MIATITVGLAPSSVDVNAATNRIYVLHGDRHGVYLPGTVSVIDGETNSVIATVPVGVSARRVAVNPNTNKIYVTNYREQFVTIIDGATNDTTTVNVGSGSSGLAVNRVTNKIYVGTISDVVVIDGTTNTATHITVTGVPLDFGSPADMAVNSVTNTIFVSTLVDGYLGNLSIIDGATNTTRDVLLGRSYAANQIADIAVNSVTNQAYASVFFYHGSWVANIDGASLAVRSIANGDMFDPLVGGIAVNPMTNKIYVPHSSGMVSVIDGTTLNTASGTAAANSHFITVDPALNQVYVLNGSDNVSQLGRTVTVIDGATNSATNLVVDVDPIAASVNPVTHRVYVVNSCGNDPTCVYPGSVPGTVSVIEAAH